MQKIVFRTDSSDKIGSGHLMRCLALADELQSNGIDIHFISRRLQGNLSHIVQEHGHCLHLLSCPDKGRVKSDYEPYPVHSEWLEVGWQEDLQETLETIQSFSSAVDWLIVDHYALEFRWENGMRELARKIMVIDDLADRSHDCDLFLDQNFYEEKQSRYSDLVPKLCKKLLGPKYALLRPEFSQQRENFRDRDGSIKRIFVFLGGNDSTDDTTKVLKALQKLDRPDITVDVVIGASNKNADKIHEQFGHLPNFVFHGHIDHMAQLMGQADLAVGAGGITTWERAAISLPSIVIALADNQKYHSLEAARAGLVVYLGMSLDVSVQRIYNVLSELVNNRAFVYFLGKQAARVCDGKGATRVKRILVPGKISLRNARIKDIKSVFSWRNHEETRQYSMHQECITWEEHQKWFKAVLDNPDQRLLIAEQNKTPVGVVRFDIEKSKAIISVYLVPGNYNRGKGSELIENSTKWIKENLPEVNRIIAHVLNLNIASQKAFGNAGYRCTSLTMTKVL